MRVKEELSEPYDEIKKAFFSVLNRSTPFRAGWQLLMVKMRLYDKITKDIDKIIDTLFKLVKIFGRYSRLQLINSATERKI